MRIKLGDFVEEIINWLKTYCRGFFDTIKLILESVINSFEWLFNLMPFWLLIILIALVALRVSGLKAAILSAAGLLLIYFINLWDASIATLSLVGTATIIAIVIGVPLGILMAKKNKANSIIKPLLDFMQTMPAFVYLIPAVYFFGLGTVPGAVATIIFAMPPVVRLTNLGIRQVPNEVIEASKAFGSTSRQMLFKVQVPLAMPTILAGLNQTILLSLSMVVISAMIGSGGLGEEVLSGVTQMKIGRGFEGGLAVVIVAMILDRVTQSLAKNDKSGINFIKITTDFIKNIINKLKVKRNKI